MKVIIFQKEVLAYRVAFFNGLAAHPGLELTLVTCGDVAEGLEVDLVRCRAGSWLGFQWFVDPPSLERFDAVVFPFDLRWPQLIGLIARSRRRLVLWGHGLGRAQWLGRLRAWIAGRARGLIVYEEAAVADFVALGVADDHLAFMGNSISVMDPERRRTPGTYFLFLGRLQERKQLTLAIEAMTLMRERGLAPPPLLIVGDGDIRTRLEERAAALGVADLVRFSPGTFDEAALKAHFSGAIAYVSPGAVGLGLIHAFAYGVPVITCDLPGHGPEIGNLVDGRNGSIVAFDRDALADCLQLYIEEPETALERGRAAFDRYANDRTIDRMIERYATALERFAA